VGNPPQSANTRSNVIIQCGDFVGTVTEWARGLRVPVAHIDKWLKSGGTIESYLDSAEYAGIKQARRTMAELEAKYAAASWCEPTTAARGR
jgi:hypothetical protein